MGKRINILICCCSFLLLCGCQLLLPNSLNEIFEAAQRENPTTPKTEAKSTTTPNAFISTMSLIELSRFEESEEFEYTIQMIHPQLENAGAKGDTFNNMVNLKLLESVNEFRGFAEENYEAMEDFGGGSFYSLDYTVYRFDQHFVSIQFSVETYFMGAAHPGITHFVINYDLYNEQEVTIGGLFLPNSQILDVLQFYSAKELNSRFPEGYFENGLETVANNYRNWNLANEGLILTFETYQVQAGAAGPQIVVIPYYLLELYIDPAGPLGFVIEQQNLETTF